MENRSAVADFHHFALLTERNIVLYPLCVPWYKKSDRDSTHWGGTGLRFLR